MIFDTGRLGSTYALSVVQKEVGKYIIEIAFDDVDVRGDRTEKVVCFAVCNVSSADCLLDFAWDEEFLEFRG